MFVEKIFLFKINITNYTTISIYVLVCLLFLRKRIGQTTSHFSTGCEKPAKNRFRDFMETYFSPKDKDEFDSQFKGKIIGIGALIQEKKGYLYLGPLTIGAPAWKSKQLNEGDKILKVRSKPNDLGIATLGE